MLYHFPPVGMRHGIKDVMSTWFESISCRDSSESLSEIVQGNMYDFCSGKAALLTSLRVLRELNPERKKIIIPSYTCYSVAAAVEQSGLKAVLCDIRPDTLDYDFELLGKLTDADTLCILATHFFSDTADIKRIRSIADRFGCYLLEDSAQSFDFTSDKNLSDIVIYSFGRGKPISCAGGGLLVTKNKEISLMVKKVHSALLRPRIPQDLRSAFSMILSDILMNPRLYWMPAKLTFLRIGETIYPSSIPITKMGKFKVLWLIKRFKNRQFIFDKRNKNALYYRQVLVGSSIASNTSPPTLNHPIRYPFYTKDTLSSYSSDVFKELNKCGVVKIYPSPLNSLSRLKAFCINCEDSFPGGEWVSEHIISLPVHPGMTKNMCKLVADKLKILTV